MTQLHSGQIIGGKYCLDEPLARGGMGSVWRAHHAQIGTPFALKFMAKTLLHSESARARFEREARATALLRSPYVVQVLDFGVEDEVPYLVMELFVGEDLSDRLKRVRKMSPAELWPILVQIAKGLQKAHDAGIVHRDLKPRNIFIAATDEGEMVKILDFGVAKISGELGHTTTGELVGSPQYMSPEQARGERDIDQRSDLWSLSAIAYRALTGELAFSGEGIGDIIMKIALEKPALPSSVAPGLSPEVDRFFEKAFARDRNQRFQSVQEFVRAFAVLAGDSEPWSAGGARSVRMPNVGGGPISSPSGAGFGDAGPASYSVTPAPMHTPVPGDKTYGSGQRMPVAPRPKRAWDVLIGLGLALVFVGGGAAFYVFSLKSRALSSPASAAESQAPALVTASEPSRSAQPNASSSASTAPPAAISQPSAEASALAPSSVARRPGKAVLAPPSASAPQPKADTPAENPDLGY